MDRPEPIDPEAQFRAPDEKAVACAITITSQVGSNRSIVVQTYLERDAPLSLYNGVLDKLTGAVDRQEAKLSLEGLEADLKRMETNHKKLCEDFAGIEERAQKAWDVRGKKGAFRLSEAELTQKQQALNTIAAGKENIARLKADIEKVRRVAIGPANDED